MRLNDSEYEINNTSKINPVYQAIHDAGKPDIKVGCPIVKVKTPDGLTLHGLLTQPESPGKTIIIHLHGCGGNFYGNSYFELLTNAVTNLGIAYLSTNNRGSGVYELEKGTVPHGVALEKFEDCILDIDSWIELAIDKGYQNIILEGHSYGTEKIVYYMNKGRYVDNVKGIHLFGFSDNVGHQAKYEKENGKNYLQEAKQLMAQGKPFHLLGDLDAYCGELPVSAQTYTSIFYEESANGVSLPLRKGRDLNYFKNIHVPILAVIGDMEDQEYTVIPIKEAVALLESENNLAEGYIIEDSDHVFTGKEKELVNTVTDFLQRRILI